MQEMSDAELAAQTVSFKEQIAQGATLDSLLVPAFAVAREAGRRQLVHDQPPRRRGGQPGECHQQ